MTETQAVETSGTRPAPSTIIAAGIVIFIGGLFVLVVAGLMVYLTVQLLGGHGDSFSQSIGTLFLPFFLLILLFILLLAGCVVLMGWLILKRRNGARWTAIVLFGLFAVSALGQSTTGSQSAPANRAIEALLMLLVPILLLIPPTARGFPRRQGPAPGSPHAAACIWSTSAAIIHRCLPTVHARLTACRACATSSPTRPPPGRCWRPPPG